MRLPIRLTDMGKVLYENDPTLETFTTQWFLHHELTGDPLRAEAWYFFAREFLPSQKSFSMSELLAGLTDKLRSHSEAHFGPGSKLNLVILRKMIECYTEEHALGGLGLIREDGDGFVRSRAKKKQGPWHSVEALRAAYGRE